MPIYKVTYSSMTARYGPTYIEADDESVAKRRFAKGAFSEGEMRLISATEVSPQEMVAAMNKAKGGEE